MASGLRTFGYVSAINTRIEYDNRELRSRKREIRQSRENRLRETVTTAVTAGRRPMAGGILAHRSLLVFDAVL